MLLPGLENAVFDRLKPEGIKHARSTVTVLSIACFGLLFIALLIPVNNSGSFGLWLIIKAVLLFFSVSIWAFFVNFFSESNSRDNEARKIIYAYSMRLRAISEEAWDQPFSEPDEAFRAAFDQHCEDLTKLAEKASEVDEALERLESSVRKAESRINKVDAAASAGIGYGLGKKTEL